MTLAREYIEVRMKDPAVNFWECDAYPACSGKLAEGTTPRVSHTAGPILLSLFPPSF